MAEGIAKTKGLREALDRFEQAAMAYERLGSIKKDDEKSRKIRRDAMVELSDARRNLAAMTALGEVTESMAVLEERDRCRRIAKYHTHHALWAGIADTDMNTFGTALANRITTSIAEEAMRPGRLTPQFMRGFATALDVVSYKNKSGLRFNLFTEGTNLLDKFDPELVSAYLGTDWLDYKREPRIPTTDEQNAQRDLHMDLLRGHGQ